MEKKISVIIPVYNAGKHIVATLDSLAKQTMDQDDFEVLCIDDASSDDSIAIIESFKPVIPGLKVIERRENAGAPSLPRNQGMAAAIGEYLLFMDADDFLGEETLTRFYEKAKANQSDVLIGKYIGVNGRSVPKSQFSKGNRLKADLLADNLVYTMAPHKLFRTAFLREINVSFDTRAIVAEDQIFTMICYIEAQVITVLADYDYYYVVSRGDDNLSTKYMSPEILYYAFDQVIKNIIARIPDEKRREDVIVAFLRRTLNVSRLRGMLFSEDLTREQVTDWFTVFQVFFRKYVSDEHLVRRLQIKYRYIVRALLEGTLDDLLDLHKKLPSVTKNDIVSVDGQGIIAKFRTNTTHQEWLIEVDHLNTVKVKVTGISLRKDAAIVAGRFESSLTENFPRKYRFSLVNRDSQEEVSMLLTAKKDQRIFSHYIPYSELAKKNQDVGPWDLFLESNTNGFVTRRRLGAKRDSDPARITESVMIPKDKPHFVVKPYFTKNFDNLTFQVDPLNEGGK